MTKDRFLKIRYILLLVLALNWLVAFAKIIYGYMTNTNSMVADGFHSFSDGTSNIIGIIGIYIASRPADEHHPYGHKKYETFASITIAILLFLIAFNLIKSSIARFVNPATPEVNLLSFAVMFVTMAINLAVFNYEHGKSRQLTSDILHADAEHTRSDILVSVSVICTLLAIKAGFPLVDTIVAFVISVLIAKSAFEILKASSEVLCDGTVIISDQIRDVVMRVGGVKEAHQIRTRGRSDDVHVDLHITVDASMHVGTAHNITEEIEYSIKKNIKGVSDVVVHIEPENVHN